MNKEIRFSAKDTGVADLMSRLRAESKRLYDDIAKDAKESSSSQKESVKYIEDQIKAIERRNKIDRESQKLSSRDKYESRMESATTDKQRTQIKDQFQKEMSDLNKDSQADKMQVELLKDLLETTRQNSQAEIKAEGKQAAEDRMHRERLNQDSLDDNRRLQDQQSQPGFLQSAVKGVLYARGMSKMMEQGESGGRAALDSVSSGLMMSGNPYAMAAGGILDFLTGAFTLVQKQQQLVHQSGLLTGRTGESLVASEFGYGGSDQDRIERIGMDREEYLGRYNNSVKSYGKTIDESHAMRDIYASKTMGIDEGLVNEIQKLTRTMSGYGEVQGVTNQIYRSMYNTGALGKNNNERSRMADIINTAVSMQTDRFLRTGSQSGFDDRLKLMRGLEFAGGAYKDDRYKQATLQQLESGVGTMPNKMVHAIKLKTAKDMFPNMNPFELFSTIQSGDPRLIEPLLQQVMQSTDNETLGMQRMFDLFGGQLSAQNVVQLYKKGKTRSDGGALAVGLPGGDWSVAGSSNAYRQMAQGGTPELNAEFLMMWNNAVAASAAQLMKLQNAIAGILNLM
jgi:hypothetical protein